MRGRRSGRLGSASRAAPGAHRPAGWQSAPGEGEEEGIVIGDGSDHGLAAQRARPRPAFLPSRLSFRRGPRSRGRCPTMVVPRACGPPAARSLARSRDAPPYPSRARAAPPPPGPFRAAPLPGPPPRPVPRAFPPLPQPPRPLQVHSALLDPSRAPSLCPPCGPAFLGSPHLSPPTAPARPALARFTSLFCASLQSLVPPLASGPVPHHLGRVPPPGPAWLVPPRPRRRCPGAMVSRAHVAWEAGSAVIRYTFSGEFKLSQSKTEGVDASPRSGGRGSRRCGALGCGGERESCSSGRMTGNLRTGCRRNCSAVPDLGQGVWQVTKLSAFEPPCISELTRLQIAAQSDP